MRRESSNSNRESCAMTCKNIAKKKKKKTDKIIVVKSWLYHIWLKMLKILQVCVNRKKLSYFYYLLKYRIFNYQVTWTDKNKYVVNQCSKIINMQWYTYVKKKLRQARIFRFSKCENYSLKRALHEYMHYMYYTKHSIFISIIFEIYSADSLLYIR